MHHDKMLPRTLPKFGGQLVNLADDPQLLGLMVEAGFGSVFVGIQTPDQVCLEECNKFQNEGRDMVESVKRIQRAGIRVQGGFIVGFDHATSSIFQRQIEFIQKSGIWRPWSVYCRRRMAHASTKDYWGKTAF
jgi:radical SAM superfamily enzyme YgiQ (UPF0313 family)